MEEGKGERYLNLAFEVFQRELGANREVKAGPFADSAKKEELLPVCSPRGRVTSGVSHGERGVYINRCTISQKERREEKDKDKATCVTALWQAIAMQMVFGGKGDDIQYGALGFNHKEIDSPCLILSGLSVRMPRRARFSAFMNETDHYRWKLNVSS